MSDTFDPIPVLVASVFLPGFVSAQTCEILDAFGDTRTARVLLLGAHVPVLVHFHSLTEIRLIDRITHRVLAYFGYSPLLAAYHGHNTTRPETMIALEY